MLSRLASMVLNQHHLITPHAAEAVLGALDGRIGELELDGKTEGFTANSFIGAPAVDSSGRSKGYRVTDRGVGIVPVRGELVNRGAWVGSYSGMTSYEGLRHVLRQVASDDRVKSIVLDVNSPGGMVAGAFETAGVVRDIAKNKPVIAVANDMMASAAYLIASSATHIVATDNAQVGSIGVLYVHTDRSGELAARGHRVTLIHAGKHKVDGHPFGALPEQVRLDIQARGNAIHSKFIDAVVTGRGGRLEAADVRSTEARVYVGEDAVEKGLADSHGTFDQAVADAEAGKITSKKASRTKPTNDNPAPAKEAAKMSTEPGGPAAASGWEGMPAEQLIEAVDRLRASLGGATQTATVETEPAPAKPPAETADAAFARGRSEERARISAIMDHEHAKKRPVQARVLALESDTAVDQAGKMLAMMPEETAAATGTTSNFYAAMANNGGKPNVPLVGDQGDKAAKPGGALAASMSKMLAQNKAAASPR